MWSFSVYSTPEGMDHHAVSMDILWCEVWKKMNSFPQEQQIMAWAGNVCETFKLGLAHL